MSKTMLTTDNLFEQLEEMISVLLKLTNTNCWNSISNNLKYIIRDIPMKQSSLSKAQKVKLLATSEPLDLVTATEKLIPNFDDIYDINLFIFKAEKHQTLIEIAIFKKSAFNHSYQLAIQNDPPMLHSKVAVPPYLKDNKKKFDINWQWETFEYRWKMWWRTKYFFNSVHH